MNQRLLNKLAKAKPKKVELNLEQTLSDVDRKINEIYDKNAEIESLLKQALDIAWEMSKTQDQLKIAYLDNLYETREKLDDLGIDIPRSLLDFVKEIENLPDYLSLYDDVETAWLNSKGK